MWVVIGLRITYLPWLQGLGLTDFCKMRREEESEFVSRAIPVVSELPEGSREGLT